MRDGTIQTMDRLVTIGDVSVNPHVSNFTAQAIQQHLAGPLGSRILLSFCKANLRSIMADLGQGHRSEQGSEEELDERGAVYAVQLTRSLVEVEDSFVAPMALRFVFVENDVLDVAEFSPLNALKSVDIMSRAIIKEIQARAAARLSSCTQFLRWKDCYRNQKRIKFALRKASTKMRDVGLRKICDAWKEICWKHFILEQLSKRTQLRRRSSLKRRALAMWSMQGFTRSRLIIKASEIVSRQRNASLAASFWICSLCKGVHCKVTSTGYARPRQQFGKHGERRRVVSGWVNLQWQRLLTGESVSSGPHGWRGQGQQIASKSLTKWLEGSTGVCVLRRVCTTGRRNLLTGSTCFGPRMQWHVRGRVFCMLLLCLQNGEDGKIGGKDCRGRQKELSRGETNC